MGLIKYVKEEIAVIRERDPAIKSNMEVFLYPTFHAILKYPLAHKLYRKDIISGPDGFPRGQRAKPGSRFTRELRSEKDSLSITAQG